MDKESHIIKEYRMPFPEPVLPILLVGVLAALVSTGAFKMISRLGSTAREQHTKFVLTQISDQLERLTAVDFPGNSSELMNTLKSASIDWNSCQLGEMAILDGWGQPIQLILNPTSEQWTFQSAGKDRKFGSEDDLTSFATKPSPYHP